MATVEMVESLAVVAESLAEVAAMAVVEAAVVMAVMTVVAVAGLLAMVTGLVELLVELLATVVGAGEEILWEQAEERSPRGARKQGQSKVNHHCCRRPDSS